MYSVYLFNHRLNTLIYVYRNKGGHDIVCNPTCAQHRNGWIHYYKLEMLPFINTFTICVCVYTVNANKKIVCTEVSIYLITLNKVGVSKLNTCQGDILNEIQEIF